ncbi:MAG: hypothetical protein Greene041679_664 [Parcubacteria group bacterium Greene0416_79]|nr:MAG: hypothetical protein Greene041679_664 [Parcubacteria group bacterium Greene0416_79]
MKKLLLGVTIIQGVIVAYGLLMYLGISELALPERQTFVIMVNVKIVLLVAFYIAWRVTPTPSLPTETENTKD